MRRFLLFLVILLPLMLVGCVSMVLPKVSGRTIEAPVRPGFGPEIASLEAWEANRADLQQMFLDEIYGAYPPASDADILAHEVIDDAAYAGRGFIEQYHLSLAGRESYLVTVQPVEASGPVPVVVMQMFCGNRAAFGGREDIALAPGTRGCDGNSWEAILVRGIFGQHIMEPPIAEILARGYALAIIYPGDVVPDSSSRAPEALETLMPGQTGGAISAWAWVYSRVVDVLEADPRFDPERMAVWGHSRNGKSAVLAAAFDPRIDLVIAHQAGTGGTTLSRSHNGESIEQITGAYPYWFAPGYSDYAGREDALPVDQHQLIALVAPRPILIGGAWRDNWSDPQGSFRAAQAANPVYALYGSEGLTQPDLAHFDPEADLAVFMRRGLHGVTPADWSHFLDFLDAHFQPE